MLNFNAENLEGGYEAEFNEKDNSFEIDVGNGWDCVSISKEDVIKMHLMITNNKVKPRELTENELDVISDNLVDSVFARDFSNHYDSLIRESSTIKIKEPQRFIASSGEKTPNNSIDE